MTRTAVNYGTVLYQLNPPEEAVREMTEIFRLCPEAAEILDNPVISRKETHAVVDRLFPEPLRNFGKLVSDGGHARKIGEMAKVYQNCKNQERHILAAELFCVTEPGDKELEGFRKFLLETYQAEDVQITVRKKPDLIGGFLLRVGCREYDWSLRGRLQQLRQSLIRR